MDHPPRGRAFWRLVHPQASASTLATADHVLPTAGLADQPGYVEYQVRDGSGNEVDRLGVSNTLTDEAVAGQLPLPAFELYQDRSWVRAAGGCQDTDNFLEDFIFVYAFVDADGTTTPRPCS